MSSSTNSNYQKVFFNNNNTPLKVIPNEICSNCARKNLTNPMKFMYLNFDEAMYKCSSSDCMYPFRNFIFKDVKTNKLYRYQFQETINLTNQSETGVIELKETSAIESTNSSAPISKSSFKPNIIPAETTKQPTMQVNELRNCLKSRDCAKSKNNKKSKFNDVNDLLNMYSNSTKKSDCDSSKLLTSIVNPLNLIKHLNRTTMKISSKNQESMK